MSRVHIALFTPGYPYVDAALRAAQLASRRGAGFTRIVGEPFSLHRDQFARTFLESDASHALLLEGEIVPPDDVVDRLLKLAAPVATALYPQWIDDRLATNVQTTTDTTWSATVPQRVFPVRRCLLGCVLVHRDVLAKVSPPWFLSVVADDRYIADHEWFCRTVLEAGFGIRCDGGALCQAFHHGKELLALTGRTLYKT